MSATDEQPLPPPSEADVKEFLKRHPGFLAKHPDLLPILTPPSLREADGVVDMQRYMVQRLQRRLVQLSSSQDELIAAGRNNMSIQSQVHDAVLAMLEARSFEHLIHIITHDFSTILHVDVVVLLIEESELARPHAAGNNLYVVRKGTIDRMIGPGRDILLRDRSTETDLVYGPAASLVRSDALVRLKLALEAPPGLVALGSRQSAKFHPGQGTELLQFLARAVERCIRAWLDLPQD